MTLAERNRKLFEALKKGDIGVQDLITDGGYMPPEFEDRFLQKVYETTPFLNAIRKETMTGPQRKINKIGLRDDFLHAAPASGTALDASKRSKLFTEYILMTTTELMGSVYLPYDVIEDNIERGRIEDTLMDNLIPTRAAGSLEKVVINGDVRSDDSLLGSFDGVIRLQELADANVKWDVDSLVEFTDSTGAVDDPMYEAMLAKLPWKYRELGPDLRYMQHYSAWDAYIQQRRKRWTIEGDVVRDMNHLASDGYRGIPMLNTSRMNPSNMLLTVPNNIVLGVQRGIQFETARDIEARVIIIVVTLRVAVAIEESEAVVLATGVNPSGTTSSSTSTTT